MVRLKGISIFKSMNTLHAKRKKEIPPIPPTIWQDTLQFIAFGFGTGAIPFAPGTFGTLIAIPFYLLCRPLSSYAFLALVIGLTLISIWICDRVSKQIHVHDHPGMNLDEIVGYFVTMCFVPAKASLIFLGFLVFRLFDIWKPWPIRWLDSQVSGGFGVVIDDVLAGIYSCAVLHGLVWLFPNI